MAVALVQTGSEIVVSGGTSGNVVLTSVVAGNLLIVMIDDVGEQDATFGVSDDKGNTWTQAVAQTGSNVSNKSAIWYCPNPAAGTTTITVTTSPSTDFYAIAQEWSGGTWSLDTSSSIDETSTTTNHVCSASSSVIDTTAEAVVFATSAADVTTGSGFNGTSAGSGYTKITSSSTKVHWQYQHFGTATTDERGAFTSVTARRAAGCIAAFKVNVPCPSSADCWWPCCSGSGGGAAAYHCGGMNIFSTANYATTDRTCFANDLTSALSSANLTQSRGEVSAVGNPTVAGYLAGGWTGSGGTKTAVVTADKLTFSGETTAAATTANITSAKSYCAGVSERSVKGYFLGGSTDAGISGSVVTTDMLTFSGDATSAQTTANLSLARYAISGITEGSSKGYISGGATGAFAFTAVVDKITFSGDSTSACTTANLSVGRADTIPMSEGVTKGYFKGGQTGTILSTIDKITFATDASSAVTSAVVQEYGGSGSSNGTIGYSGGGVRITGIAAVLVKMDFSTEVDSTLGAGSSLSLARLRLAGVSTVAL